MTWVAVGVGVVGAGAGIYSANKSANTQKDASKQSTELQQAQYEQGLKEVAPFKELGIDVKVCDFSSNAKISDIKDNVMASEVRRHESKTQKAIQAFNSSLKNKMTYHVLAQQFGVNEKLIKYVSFIYNKAKRPDVLDKLLDNHLVSIEGRKPTDSLSAVAKALKEEMEKDIIRDESEVVHWSADAYLRTEESKDWYYNQVRMLNLDNNVPVKMLLVELANLKFKREL